MNDWIAIDQWAECMSMERPGIVFELRNEQGLSLFTQCVLPLPKAPFDWQSPPKQFRAVEAEKPRHSSPIPKAEGEETLTPRGKRG